MHLPLSLELEVTPHVGVAAGTFLCAARAGATVRLGRGIPADFGGFDDDALPLPIPLAGTFVERRTGLGVWLVARGDVRASLFDASLDGTPFLDSGQRVRREPLVASVEVGIMFSLYEHVTFGYTHTLRSPEFRGQGGPDMFGGLILQVAF
jgi:lipid A 3-O-deacylase